jgi:6-pyruvoyl-tetrahydropterin synthase
MSTTTNNLKLIKPELTDPADITKLNENWDKIDQESTNTNQKFNNADQKFSNIDQKLNEVDQKFNDIDEEFHKSSRIVTAVKGSDTTVGSTVYNNYTATIEGITELYPGLRITIIPDNASSRTNVKLNVNNLGAKNVIMPIGGVNTTNSTNSATLTNWLGKGAPVELCYDGTVWKTDIQTASAQYLYGVVPIEKGGTGATTAAQALKNLGIDLSKINDPDNLIGDLQEQLDEKQETITGAATTITSSNLTASRVLVSDSSGKVAASDVTSAELKHLDGVTSNVQTQLNEKQTTISGAATTITNTNLDVNRALISDANGKVAVADTSATELSYLKNVKSNIQTQLDGKATTDHKHDASDMDSGTLASDRLPIVPIEKGGTGATTASGALANLGLKVDAFSFMYVSSAKNLENGLYLVNYSDDNRLIEITGLYYHYPLDSYNEVVIASSDCPRSSGGLSKMYDSLVLLREFGEEKNFLINCYNEDGTYDMERVTVRIKRLF